MKTLFKWFAGFFEDHKRSASSKRATLYMCLFFFWRIIESDLHGVKLQDGNILWFVVGTILFCIGAVTSEFFSKEPMEKINEQAGTQPENPNEPRPR